MITLGLNNGETVGQRMDAAPHPLNAGMINIVATISVRLTDAGLLEVSSIITLARTASLPHFGYRRPVMEEIDIGTGTDCIVAAAPVADDPVRFAGMHTAMGEAVWRAFLQASEVVSNTWLDGQCRGSKSATCRPARPATRTLVRGLQRSGTEDRTRQCAGAARQRSGWPAQPDGGPEG